MRHTRTVDVEIDLRDFADDELLHECQKRGLQQPAQPTAGPTQAQRERARHEIDCLIHDLRMAHLSGHRRHFGACLERLEDWCGRAAAAVGGSRA